MAATHVTSKRVILLTLGVVVAAFVGASSYSEHRANRTHALTAEIASNQSPSIAHLASARAELRDLHRLLNAHVLLTAAGRHPSAQPIGEARARLRANLDAYFALPAQPPEQELGRRIRKELADVDALAGRILDETAAGRYVAAEQLLLVELPAAIDEEADALVAAIELNAQQVHEVAEEIERERRERVFWVFGLDGISVALAVALAALALRTVARQEALILRRSEELEGFAGRVAHDLLNPIAAVHLSLAAIERTDGDPARRTTALARARRSLDRARRLIDDLLMFARAGARPEEGAVTSVADVVEGVVEELRAPALEKGITVDVEPAPAPAPAVRCATGVLASLLSNLLRNAIKHMGDRPRRRVCIRVARLADRVRFEVEDTGPGLPPDLARRAFDPYVRGGATGEPGLGLGLATVRRLVDGHGGRHGVRSQPGEGALFWFELPSAPLPAAAARAGGPGPEPPPPGPGVVPADADAAVPRDARS